MSDEERQKLASMIRAYKTIKPYDLQEALKAMADILDYVDHLVWYKVAK